MTTSITLPQALEAVAQHIGGLAGVSASREPDGSVAHVDGGRPVGIEVTVSVEALEPGPDRSGTGEASVVVVFEALITSRADDVDDVLGFVGNLVGSLQYERFGLPAAPCEFRGADAVGLDEQDPSTVAWRVLFALSTRVGGNMWTLTDPPARVSFYPRPSFPLRDVDFGLHVRERGLGDVS